LLKELVDNRERKETARKEGRTSDSFAGCEKKVVSVICRKDNSQLNVETSAAILEKSGILE